MRLPLQTTKLSAQVPAIALMVLGLAAGVGSAGRVQAASEPEIGWYLYDIAPFTIVEGPHKGEGMYDKLLMTHVIPGLTGYRHRIAVVPISRRDLSVKADEKACGIGLFKNLDREQYMTFSLPIQALIPLGAFIRAADSARVENYLDSNGKLSLTKLLDHGVMKLGVENGRSHGATLDALVKQYKGKPHYFNLFKSSAMKSLFPLVAQGRIDVSLGAPVELAFLEREGEEGAKELRFYPLVEQPDYSYVYAACSKSEFGKAVIEKINAILRQPAVLNAVHDNYEQWLDSDSRKLARRLRQQAFAVEPKP